MEGRFQWFVALGIEPEKCLPAQSGSTRADDVFAVKLHVFNLRD
jgi:hypothetical protein